MMSAAPVRRTRSVYALGSPKENITALGRCSSARSTACVSICQVRKPMPHGLSVPCSTSGTSRASQSGSPFPEPSNPSPPPRETAAVSAPPADPPIGASAIGCRTPNSFVNAVDNAMPTSSRIALVGTQG